MIAAIAEAYSRLDPNPRRECRGNEADRTPSVPFDTDRTDSEHLVDLPSSRVRVFR
jgi:hypothetical protein